MIDDHEMRTLLRRLSGELSPQERRQLDTRLTAEPELRATAELLERSWNELDLPTDVAPPGFAAGVMARISVAEPEAPRWARLAAAAALVGGIALGVGIGRVPPEEVLPEVLAGSPAPSLAERYLDALAELDPGVEE